MTSLAVELNYSNLNASRGRRHTINRNQDDEEINNTNSNLAHNNTNNSNNNSIINNNGSINNNSNIINTNSNNLNSSQYHQSHHARFLSNTNASNVPNLTVSNSQYMSNTNKIPSPNIIYKLKTGNGVVTNNISNNNINESSSTAMSASFALINRIKSLEQQKKRNNQLSSTAIKAATNAAAQACAAAIQATPISTTVSNSYRLPNQYPYMQQQQQQQRASNSSLTNDILVESMHSMNINNSSSPVNFNLINNTSNSNSNSNLNNSQVNLSASPNTERRSAKFSRSLINSFSKSQEELFKIRTKSANPNVYQDKISDQKFFNRNFKLKSDSSTSINDYSNSISATAAVNLSTSNSYLNHPQQQQPQQQQRYLNDSPSTTDSFYHSSKQYGSNTNLNNSNYSENRNSFLLTSNSPANNNSTNTNGQVNLNNQNANHLNKLKLLKKRNALKKSLSNATAAAAAAAGQVGSAHTALSTTTSNTNLSNKSSMDTLNTQSYSKEELKMSQQSLNNLTSTSVITTTRNPNNLSRYSLNNIDSNNNSSFNTTVFNNSFSYPQLNGYGLNKSSETIDEINPNDMKNKEINMSFRAKSTGPILPNPNNFVNKTRSENELNDEKYIIHSYLNGTSINNQKNASNLSINNSNINNNTDLNNNSNSFVNEKAVLNKLLNINSEEMAQNDKLQDNLEQTGIVETVDIVEFGKRANLTSANKDRLKVNIVIKPQSAARQHQSQAEATPHEASTQQSGVQLPINDTTRMNKAVIANTTYLNRVKNGSSSHFNLINSQSNLGTNLTTLLNENQRNYSFNNSNNNINNNNNNSHNSRVKSGKLNNQVVTIKRDNSNESLERNTKIKLNNDNFSSNYRNLYSNNNNNNNNSNNNTNNYNGSGGAAITGERNQLKPTSVYVEYTLDEIDPNNIMSDPVINEQFHKLYAEDEYFQAVHKKCTEWLSKYVLPEFELLKAERMQK